MLKKELERIAEIAGSNTDVKTVAKMIVSSDGKLTRRIVEDFLVSSLPGWRLLYNELGPDVLEGHLTGPSPRQAQILRRMRDTGHRAAPVRGFFRWLAGTDDKLQRNTVRTMLEQGWLRMETSQIFGVEFILVPTLAGMRALANYEMDKVERVYP